MRKPCAATLRAALLDCSANGTLAQALTAINDDELRFLSSDWDVWARDDQLPPAGAPSGSPWRLWLILGGRGSGKTRAGAEWIRARVASAAQPERIALVGETLGDVRRVMIEGVSGLLNVHADAERPRFEPSKREVTWANGSVAQMFAADEPDSLRGPQFTAAWCDEVAKWRKLEAAWDMLAMGLRLGDCPQAVATTTPRSRKFLNLLMADVATVVTRSKTRDNAANLAPAFFSEMLRRYGGSDLGRQELDGEIVAEVAGSLWQRDWIAAHRVERAPDLIEIVVAIDPPVTATADSDACGIVVAGLGEDRRAYVIADRTVQGRTPQAWARAAIAAYRDYAADRIVAEVNQGGDLVVAVLRQFDETVPVRKVVATRGKWVRAEPVAALYSEGRVSHVGPMPALEDELAAFGAGGAVRGRSPDRADALVWALTDLLLDRAARPTVRMV